MKLSSMLTNIRIRCGGPKAQAPSDRLLLLLLSSQLQNFATEANLSGRPWSVEEMNLEVTSGEEDYPLPIDASFGKPIQVRTVYPSDPGHIERDIDFFDIGDLNFGWPFPKNFGSAGSLDSSPNNAARLAFFRKGGQVYARVLPIPATSATYQILYQVGVYGETVPLEDIPILPEHHTLLEIRTSLAALPHCEWSDDRAANKDKRGELAMSMVPDSQRLERNFKLYTATVTGHRGMSVRLAPVDY